MNEKASPLSGYSPRVLFKVPRSIIGWGSLGQLEVVDVKHGISCVLGHLGKYSVFIWS